MEKKSFAFETNFRDKQIIPRKMLYLDKGVIRLYADWIAPEWVKKLVELNNEKSAS